MHASASPHEQWQSRTGFIMATIGAAVGLGNIWKFPYTLGNSGGGAFVLIYLAAIFVIATPIIMSEMVIGRLGGLSPPATFKKLAKETGASPAWAGAGWLGVVAIFFVLSFFSVIAGWSLAYVLKSATGVFTGLSAAEAESVFGEFLHEPLKMTAWHLGFMAFTVFIVARGINSGIERAVNVLMPGLFVILVGLVIYAGVNGDFSGALRYLFVPDFSKVTAGVALSAIGQAFFSVNVGIGAILIYSAYLPANVNLPRSALIIAIGDTLVAMLAVLAIFPLVFALDLDPAKGPGLIFVTLSAAFGNMPGGAFFGAAFFAFVFVAALTSAISMLEVMVSRAEESAGVRRVWAAPVIAFCAFLVGLLTVFSFNRWETVFLLGSVPGFEEKKVFDLIDYLVTNIMLPLGGMLFALFAGWWLSRESTMDVLGLRGGLYTFWRVLTRFVGPAVIATIFVWQIIEGYIGQPQG